MTISRASLPDNQVVHILRESFSGIEEPLKQKWLAGLSENLKQIAIEAQQCLLAKGRDQGAIACMAAQINEWRQDRESPVHNHNTPPLIVKAELGSRLQLDWLVDFLLAEPSYEKIKKHDYMAVALLMEVCGLVFIIKNHSGLTSEIQRLSCKIAKLHTGMLLFRAIDDAPLEEQEVFSKALQIMASDRQRDNARNKHAASDKIKGWLLTVKLDEIAEKLNETKKNRMEAARWVFWKVLDENQREAFPAYSPERTRIAEEIKGNPTPTNMKNFLSSNFTPYKTIAAWLTELL